MKRTLKLSETRRAEITVAVPITGDKTYRLSRRGNEVKIMLNGAENTYDAEVLRAVAWAGLAKPLPAVTRELRGSVPSVYRTGDGPVLNVCGLPYYQRPEEFRRLLMFIHNFCR